MALLVVIVAAVAALTIASIGSTNHPRKGCLDAVVPGPIGATFFKQCGASARNVCADLRSSNDLNATGVATVAVDCRRAGYPVG